jgi:signal transduction histidine kinase/ligand-binding sensor domain-containing protein
MSDDARYVFPATCSKCGEAARPRCREHATKVKVPAVTRRRSAARQLCRPLLLVLCSAPLVVAVPVSEAPVARPSSAEAVGERALVEARINPKPIELPVVESNDLRFAHVSTPHGLSQTRVQQIVQDDQGFLWFGTQHGLNRYDGYTFRVFTHDPARIHSLGGVYIFSLFKDRAGYLWIGSDDALDRFDPRTETFTHYRLQRPGADETGVTVFHINQDHEGEIWLATGSGLFRLDPDTGRTTLFQHDLTDSLSLASNDVKSTLEDRNHRFWVATRSGLDEFDRSTGKVRLHVPISKPVREFLAYEDRDGLLWLGYASGGGAGLSSYDPKSNVLSDYAFAAKDVRSAAFTGIYAIAQDHDGALWLGTGGMGLLKLDRSAKKFLRYRHVEGDPDSISEDHVIALSEDGQGNMWVGLNSTEPNSFPVRAGFFRRILPTLGPHGGGERLIGSIFEDREGTLWVGATGLTRIDPENSVSTYYAITQSAVSTEVIAIAQDAAGDLWLGTVGQGLKRFNPRTGSLKAYIHDPSNPNSLSDDVVSDLRFDGPDDLWISTWDGLDLLNIPSGTFTAYKPNSPQRTPGLGRIAQDRQGTLWVAGDPGLTHFDPRTSQILIAKHADGMPTISSNGVTFVFIDTDGQLWIGTRNGLDKLNADGTFTSYQERDGLGGSSVGCILEDDAGRLWLSTNKGLSSFDRKSHVFTNYGAADGVGDLTGWNTCLKTSSGELFFAGFSGAVTFHPSRAAESVSHAPIRFTDLKVQGRSVPIAIGSVLTRSIGYTSAITLSHDQRNFSLEFASLSFMDPGSIRYRYKMEGLDSQWNELGGDRRAVSYSDLPFGSYTFRAQSAVGRGTWTEPEAALRVHILPPWWRSWWFTAAVVVLLIVVAVATYRYRLGQIARQYDIRLEERVNERTRIARELHDSLLQGFQGLMFRLQAVRDLLPDRAAEAVEELDGALERGDEAIVEGREAVRDLRTSTAARTDLEDSLEALADELRARPGETAPSYRVLVQGKVRPMAPLVRDDVYRIAREAFRNAVQHALAGKIEAEIDYGDGAFQLRVRDDGVGIDPEVLGRRIRTGHWGLQGMRERAEALGGHLEIWSEPSLGTEVELAIPARIAYGRTSSRGHKDLA